MKIAVDFDGTIVTHEYPRIGRLVPGAKRTINTLLRNGHQVFLWTMRSGEQLEHAKTFLQENGIGIRYFNESPNQDWTTSPKQYANIYIDDAALGCPQTVFHEHQVVDWVAVSKYLINHRIISNEQYIEIQKSIYQ